MSARLPAAREPQSSSFAARAGTMVAASMAVSSGTPKETARRTASPTLMQLPAMVPSSRRATPPERRMGRPPSSYSPSGIPAQRRESEISDRRPAKMAKAMRTAEGWTCRPSQMISVLAPASKAAPMTPGLRWWMGGMALKRCVAWLAPRA